jgi:(p)ppGpp synthase/HD superfamily hydrolase
VRISRAISLAAEAHDGQLDKQGFPYIYHPLRVMEAVWRVGESYAIVAVLHDVIEDTDYDLDTQVAERLELTDEEYRALGLVTHWGAGQPNSYRPYIVACSKDRIARVVKVADISDNLGRLTPELAGLEKRYKAALAFLREPEAYAWETDG